ncbi:MAG: hypothetical protein AAB395_01425 [Patescibacteria group bacterium]
MNNKVIIGIVVAVIIIGGGAALYMANSSNTKQSETKKVEATNETETSLSALLEKGDPQKCTYSGEVKSGEYTGTSYFSSDKQMRNDYKSTANGETRNGSMIITGDTQYFWNTESKKGFKTAIKADDSQQANSQENESVDTKAKFTFKCTTWTVDDSKFTPPSDVNIQDLTQIMHNIPTPTPTQ